MADFGTRTSSLWRSTIKDSERVLESKSFLLWQWSGFSVKLTIVNLLKTDFWISNQFNQILTLQGPSNRNRDVFIYEGDLKDEETVLDFLTDDDNFSMGDKIEDVDAENLINIIETDPYVSVFFYDDTKESSKALEHMEDIDDETDVFNIR